MVKLRKTLPLIFCRSYCGWKLWRLIIYIDSPVFGLVAVTGILEAPALPCQAFEVHSVGYTVGDSFH